jgi:hypothetical protein
LSIGRPLKFAPCRAIFSASLLKPVQINRFRTFARNRQNGFIALGNCFVKTSSTNRMANAGPVGAAGVPVHSEGQIIAKVREKGLRG